VSAKIFDFAERKLRILGRRGQLEEHIAHRVGHGGELEIDLIESDGSVREFWCENPDTALEIVECLAARMRELKLQRQQATCDHKALWPATRDFPSLCVYCGVVVAVAVTARPPRWTRCRFPKQPMLNGEGRCIGGTGPWCVRRRGHAGPHRWSAKDEQHWTAMGFGAPEPEAFT